LYSIAALPLCLPQGAAKLRSSFLAYKKAALPLPAGEAEEAQAEFISAVAAGLGAEPHLSDGNCGAVS